jgi:hypothetical protein
MIGISLSLPGVAALNKGGGVPFAKTAAILGAGGLDYAILDSSAPDRMWQEATGQTQVSAIGNSVGLIVGREKQDRKTFAQVMAGQAELRANAIITTAGTPPEAASYDGVTGVGSLSRGSGTANQTYLRWGTTAGEAYLVDLENLGPNILSFRDSVGTGYPGIGSIVAGDRIKVVLVSNGGNFSIRMSGDSTAATFKVHSVKKLPAHYASQSVNNSRPVLQSDGLKFDGSDDNLLTDWFAQSGANCIIAQVTVPASVVATTVIAGLRNGDATGQFWVGINSAGLPAYGTGGLTPAVGASALGQSVILGLSADGTTIRRFRDELEYAQTAQAGNAPSTLVAARIGALANGASSTAWFGGSIKRIAFGKTALTLQQFQQIRAEWLAAA